MIWLAYSHLHRYFRYNISHVSREHWIFMGLLSLALTVIMLIRKRHSVYSGICLGLTVFFSLFLLDMAVGIRWGDSVKRLTGFSLPAEYHRIIHGGTVRWTEMLANVAVFVPFGFFLSEFLATTKRVATRRQIGRVALAAFGLSLCIESLQLILRLGVFEITDLVLNTLGGVVGALMSAGVRKVVGEWCHWH